MMHAKDIEVGVRGQNLSVRASSPPTGDRQYGSDAEFGMDLTLARELLRLLTEMIPLAEKSKPAVDVVALGETGTAA